LPRPRLSAPPLSPGPGLGAAAPVRAGAPRGDATHHLGHRAGVRRQGDRHRDPPRGGAAAHGPLPRPRCVAPGAMQRALSLPLIGAGCVLAVVAWLPHHEPLAAPPARVLEQRATRLHAVAALPTYRAPVRRPYRAPAPRPH